MGRISIAAFKAKPGKDNELQQVLDDRLPLLRRLGMATNRAPINCRTKDGVIISISEWVSDAAIEKAHQTPEVLALWNRFFACCTWVKLDTLAESHDDFATFDAVN